MTFALLTLDIDQRGVAFVALNRPEIHNAFDDKLIAEPTKAFEQLEKDTSVRLVVLSGNGKSFCAGGDLNWMRSMKGYSREENIADSKKLSVMYGRIHALSKPLIGVVQGAALGGGSGLAAVCDFVIAAEDAKFGFTETRLGILPAVTSPYALDKIGSSAARAYFISGMQFSAQTAKEIGLAHQVVPVDSLQTARDTIIVEFLKAAPQASRKAKLLVRTLVWHPQERALMQEMTVQSIAEARVSDEGQEGMDALLSKRKPKMGAVMKPIKRLLIANRGEIVRRITATCRVMGIETVALYAEDDATLPHAAEADIACKLEGSSLAETYLNIDQIIAIAKRTKADAIHPGYGFLSENAKFAEAVTKAGLTFVGPPAKVIALMGDKAESRKLCEKIGVPVIPGYSEDKQDAATLTAAAKKIGFPVLVKAAAGGGGKGMRIVEQEKDLAAALQSAASEAKSAFANDRLLLEKYLQQPRHIEVQVFSDTQGNHLHFFERECSIQRRHQKIVEESPAANLPAATRKKMFDAAIKITQHIGYVGAGTMEFILDSSGEFYFLEMNTRLQVEHPVTELVTGLDLVKLQIEVAQGGKLPMKQEEVKQTGHAIEVRLYAEDAERDFLPSPGELLSFTLPHLPHLRCENGYLSGNAISSRYDPMIAKLAAWGAIRDEAIARLLNGLEGTRIAGVTTNRAFLMRVLDAKPFRDGKTSTDFIVRHAALLKVPELSDTETAQLAAAYLLFSTTSAVRPSATSQTEHSAWTHAKLAGFR